MQLISISNLLLFTIYSSSAFAGILKIPVEPQFKQSANGNGKVEIFLGPSTFVGSISLGTPRMCGLNFNYKFTKFSAQNFDVVFDQDLQDFWVANQNFTDDTPWPYRPEHSFMAK